VSPAQADVVPPSWPMRREREHASRRTLVLAAHHRGGAGLDERRLRIHHRLDGVFELHQRPQASWVGVTHTGSTELSMSGVSALRPRFFTAVVEPNSSIICAMRPDRPVR
jgi:hypothetical protein